MSFQISLNSNKSTIHREYQPEIPLEGPYEVGLKSFVTYNSIPNISKSLKTNTCTVRDHATSILISLEIEDGTTSFKILLMSY